MSNKIWAIAIQGGAGPAHKDDYNEEIAHMREVLAAARHALSGGRNAIDVVNDAVRTLEESGHHTAGKGASPNRDGKSELDAAIMDGATRNAGAVGALRGFRSPVDCARALLDQSPHVFLVGKGANHYMKKKGLGRIHHPGRYYKPAIPASGAPEALHHGSVGAVALDSEGRLAAATSTGGLVNKSPGRIGDAPVIGAGTWADERVAVSCTGQGEYFMRTVAAAGLSAQIRYERTDLAKAADNAIEDVSLLGGQGGLIAIDDLGRIAMPFNTQTMKRGMASFKGEFDVKVL